MITLRSLENLELVSEFKQQYLLRATGPLDGMWLLGFVPMAQHYGFYSNGDLIGYCCINSEGYILQFYVSQEYTKESSYIFSKLVSGTDVSEPLAGAFSSTAEPEYLSHCVDNFGSLDVNALMYEQQGQRPYESTGVEHQLTLLEPHSLAVAVAFAHETLGAPTDWLEGYFGKLIESGELYGFWKEGRLLATGESRARGLYQAQYTDVGVIVGKSQQGKGLGTEVLRQLVQRNDRAGQHSICSTEKGNLAAQKAIERAGFVARNRIIQFTAGTHPNSG